MKYRKEIDGLRAVAVLPVVLFHAGFTIFSGGYVGVDVFFVISGFLITSIICSELESGSFSLVNFYERRARRILPALFLVVFVSIPFAYEWMLSVDLESYARSVMAVAVSVSNFLFWREVDYFRPSAELKPLLHTWSLAVEEQYYILFPVSIMAIWRFGKRFTVAIIALGALLSLFIAEWAVDAKPTAGFYLLPSRAFELLTGSLLACWASSTNARKLWQSQWRGTREVMSAAGLALIVYAIFWFDAAVPFPSRYTLVPVIGAALVLAAATPETWTGRFLANPAFVSIGMVSYSLYLWHQPLFAFAKIRSFEEPSPTLMFAMSILAGLLAWASWHFVEKPFRNRNIISRRRIFQFSAAGTIACIALGLAGTWTKGFGTRTLPDGTTYAELSDMLRPNPGLGEIGETCSNGFTLAPECRTDVDPEIIVWGDSFAMHHVPGLLANIPDAKMIQMTMNLCGPLLGIAPYNGAEAMSQNCLGFNTSVLDYIKSSKSLKYAVLASNFNQYTDEAQYYYTAEGLVPRNLDLARAALRRSLDALIAKGIKPILIWPTPEAPTYVGRLFAKNKLFGRTEVSYDFSRAEADARHALISDLLTPLKASYTVIDLRDFLCRRETCHPVDGSTLLYVDNGHLTREGSQRMAQKIDYRKLFGVGYAHN